MASHHSIVLTKILYNVAACFQEDKTQCSSTYPVSCLLMFASCLLMSHWLKQVMWPSQSECERGCMAFGRITPQENYIGFDEARLEDGKAILGFVHGLNILRLIICSISNMLFKSVPGTVPDTGCTKMTKIPFLLSRSYQIISYRQTRRQCYGV